MEFLQDNHHFIILLSLLLFNLNLNFMHKIVNSIIIMNLLLTILVITLTLQALIFLNSNNNKDTMLITQAEIIFNKYHHLLILFNRLIFSNFSKDNCLKVIFKFQFKITFSLNNNRIFNLNTKVTFITILFLNINRFKKFLSSTILLKYMIFKKLNKKVLLQVHRNQEVINIIIAIANSSFKWIKLFFMK